MRFLHQVLYPCYWEWKQGGNYILFHRTIVQQKGLIRNHVRVQCLLDDDEGRHFYLYIIEGGVNDMENCRQLDLNGVVDETNQLAFYVIVCCFRWAKKLCDGMNDLYLVGFFIDVTKFCCYHLVTLAFFCGNIHLLVYYNLL